MSAITKLVTQQLALADTAEACDDMENQLETLLAQVKSKKAIFEEKDKEMGLNYAGRNAFICDCGNTTKEDGAYVGTCEDCEEPFCIECLTECDRCRKSICTGGECERDDPCAVMCEGCEDMLLCSDCLQVCNYCKEKKCCKDCLQDTASPYDDFVCPDCFDYIKNINM